MTLIDGSGSADMLPDIAAAIVRALHINGEPDCARYRRKYGTRGDRRGGDRSRRAAA
jgi:hypothetical protein